MEDFDYGKNTFMAMGLMEHISHRQTGVTFADVWISFHRAADAVHGDPKNPLPNPILLNTDCAGQLQNGWILALRVKGQVLNRVMMNNVTLIILCWYEHQNHTGNVENITQSAYTAYRFFEILVPSGIHSCRSHVCRAFKEWVTSKDRPEEVKNLGDRFVHMFAHIADRVTSMESVRDAMTLLLYMIDLLNRDQVKLRAFDLNSPVCKHHNKLEWFRYARELKRDLDTAASMLFITTVGEMKARLDSEMELNEKPGVQSFSGVRQSACVAELFAGKQPLIYAYLLSVDCSKSVGVIKYHLIYDVRKNEDNKWVPVTSGFFEKSVRLPYDGGFVDNPWRCKSAANYFKTTWLKETAIWSRALVGLIKKARRRHIYDNDQHMEGVIANHKQQPDSKMNCDEPALYFHSRFNDLKESCRIFVADLEKANHIVTRKKEADTRTTEDATENNNFMVKDAIWDTGVTGAAAERKLRRKMEEIFVDRLGKKSYKKWHDALKHHVVGSGVGSLRGMGYKNFIDWMKNEEKKKGPVWPSTMRGMEHFVKHWKNGDDGYH